MDRLKDSLVYIILLNWNNANDTIACLESLGKLQYSHFKIIVIDNASRDESLNSLQSWINDKPIKNLTKIIRLDENLGFTGGNNAGMNLALEKGADFILLLNNDTIVTENFLDLLMETAQRNPNAGVIGCKIYHVSPSTKIWYSGGKINYLKGYGSHLTDDFEGIRPTEFVTGCMMLMPHQVLEKVGLFDEKFFLICEDSDLCLRIQKNGYNLLVDGRATIYHKIHASLGGKFSPANQYYFHRNRLMFIGKNLNWPQRIIFYLVQFGILIPIWTMLELFKRHGEAVAWAYRGYFDFLRGISGKCRYLK